MEFDFNYVQSEDFIIDMPEQNLSEKDKETETSSLLSSISGSQKYNVNKRKKLSFTKNYFEIGYNIKGEQTRTCIILDKNGNRCGKVYRNTGSSTGNLVAHLRDVHQIIDEDNENENAPKRLRNTKITDFARSHRPHPKHIQKQREESVLKWMLLTDQPLSAITNPAYKEKMSQFDPSFVVPGEQKIKTMIAKSYQHNYENLKNILNETAATVSLTTDLWSSRAKHGYIGVTAAWITPNFQVKDVMLEIKYAPSPHTANLVAELLYKCISSWDLNGRVTAIITDNGSNMKAAFPILNQKDQCEAIQRLPCVAHTLQLAIGKGLAPVEILAARTKRIINFFSTQKQIERLEEVQRKLEYEDIMRCIQDVQTRWNSSYYAWDRLFYLKDAIIQLQTDLYTSTNREDKKDGTKLKKIMLSEEEWELLDKLIDLLSPFEGATRYFSGGTYVTLSKMMLIIKEFTFDLATDSENSPSNDADYLNEDTIFEEGDIEIDNEEIISNITKKKISIKDPLKTEGILEKVKSNIYNALLYYWDTPNDTGLMATLLDPRYKELGLELEDKKIEIIQKLRDEFNELNSNNSNNTTPIAPVAEPSNPIMPFSGAESSLRSQKEYRQRRQSKTKKPLTPVTIDEVDSYLSMPAALEAEDPLDWWRVRAGNFPKLSQIARKYLGIPATSMSSERLFSHAGSLISAKRNRLDTSLTGQILFLKRNIRSMEVFAKEWDEV